MVAKRRSSSFKKRSHKGGLRKQLGNVVTKVPNAVLIVGEGGVDAVSKALKGASTKARRAFNHAGKIIKGDKKVVNLPNNALQGVKMVVINTAEGAQDVVGNTVNRVKKNFKNSNNKSNKKRRSSNGKKRKSVGKSRKANRKRSRKSRRY